ncbi:MAG: hypothetical protein QM657_10495 [Lacrimispora sp.]|uniref:hypothetical protein n=1 Tax=Lacrimispora sp. TaxID=2719234 RepID=UPI0039E68D5A
MNRTQMVRGNTQALWDSVRSGKSAEETGGDLSGIITGQTRKDQVNLSEGWQSGDWKEMIKKTIDQLKAQYPSLHIVIDEKESAGSLNRLAAELGSGTHLVISSKFLARMGSSPEEFARCSSVLTGTAMQLAKGSANGRASGAYVGQSAVSSWRTQAEPEASVNGQTAVRSFLEHSGKLDKTSDTKNSAVKKNTKKSMISVSRHYTGMAAARSKGQVQAVMANIQRSIGDLQMTAVYGEDEERVKAGRALRSLKKLLSKGGRKLRRLNQEELAAIRKRNAEKQQEKRKAEQARLEKEQHQRGRSSSDRALEMEGRSEESYVRGYRHYRQLKEEFEIRTADNINTAPAGTPVDGGFSGAEERGGQIVVTDTVSF